MTKKVQKAIRIYNEMVANDMIHKAETHEDYENVTVYEDINGDIVCIERNEDGKITDAWIE